MDITKFEYGLEIIEGLPGSGKSYYATRRVCKAIIKYKRPVYTNLPLKFKVVRKYLRIQGGEQLANLIRPLKEEHWKRFLQRQHAYSKFREQRSGSPRNLPENELYDLAQAVDKSASEILKQPSITPEQLTDWFEKRVQPPIYEGLNADSIPLSAIIVIDEVQHWHPMIKQGNAEGREELQAYLTMMRHHLHWIWVITQDRTRIDIIFRKMCKSVMQVRDRGMDRLAYGIRFKHFGFRGQGYRRYTPDQLEGREKDAVPIENYTIIPSMPWNSVFFRLYTSWTQAGSKRQIKKTLKRVRDDAGVTEHTARRKQFIIMRRPKFITGLYNTIHKLMFATVCVALGLVISTINNKPKTETATRETQQSETTPTPQPHNWPTYDGFAGTKPIFGGAIHSVGSNIGQRGVIRYIDTTNRSIVLVADNGYWLWEYGAQRPQPVGPVDDIRAAYERLNRADQPTGTSLEDARTNTSEGMGT